MSFPIKPLQQEPTVIEIKKVLKYYGIVSSYKILSSVTLNNQTLLFKNMGKASWKCLISFSNERFILKKFPWYCDSVQFVNSITKFQQYLKISGLPIPSIKKNKYNYLYTKLRNKELVNTYFLQTFCNGFSFKNKASNYYNFGSMLAYFHMVSSKKSLIYYNGLLKTSLVKRTLDICKICIPEMVQKKLIDNLEKQTQISNIINILLKIINQNALILESNGYNNTNIYIHGDYNPTNVLFSDNGNVIAILDFDDCCIDNPIHDVSVALLHLCCFSYKKTFNFDCLQDDFDISTACIFLDGYLTELENPQLYNPKLLLPSLKIIACKLFILGLMVGELKVSHFTRVIKIIKKLDIYKSYLGN